MWVTFFYRVCKNILVSLCSFILGVTENSQVCTGDIALSSSCHRRNQLVVPLVTSKKVSAKKSDSVTVLYILQQEATNCMLKHSVLMQLRSEIVAKASFNSVR